MELEWSEVQLGPQTESRAAVSTAVVGGSIEAPCVPSGASLEGTPGPEGAHWRTSLQQAEAGLGFQATNSFLPASLLVPAHLQIPGHPQLPDLDQVRSQLEDTFQSSLWSPLPAVDLVRRSFGQWVSGAEKRGEVTFQVKE